MTTVYSYTIYHSPNAYLGTILLRQAIAGLSGVQLVRRPIYVPRERGLMIAEMLGGKENRNIGSYLREDCRRWAERFSIRFVYPDPEVFHQRAKRWALSAYDREELPARAFYAADPKDVTRSIAPCSKPLGSRGSTSMSRTPFAGPRGAQASTPTT